LRENKTRNSLDCLNEEKKKRKKKKDWIKEGGEEKDAGQREATRKRPRRRALYNVTRGAQREREKETDKRRFARNLSAQIILYTVYLPGVPPHFAFTIALSLTHGLQLICNEMRQRSRK